MHAPLESNFLMPTGTFLVLFLVSLVVFGLLVIWPLVETVVRQQWGYTLGVILLGPIGGLLWFFVGRRETARQRQRANAADGSVIADSVTYPVRHRIHNPLAARRSRH